MRSARRRKESSPQRHEGHEEIYGEPGQSSTKGRSSTYRLDVFPRKGSVGISALERPCRTRRDGELGLGRPLPPWREARLSPKPPPTHSGNNEIVLTLRAARIPARTTFGGSVINVPALLARFPFPVLMPDSEHTQIPCRRSCSSGSDTVAGRGWS